MKTSRITGPLDQFVFHPFSKKDKDTFDDLVLKATVSAGIPLQWVENKEVKELFRFINPTLELPGRRALGGQILQNTTQKLDLELKNKVQNDSVGVTLSFDGWTNVLEQNILGSVFVTSKGEVLVWKAEDVSSERERKEEVMEKIKQMLYECKEMKAKLIAIVTDSAAAYAAAR